MYFYNVVLQYIWNLCHHESLFFRLIHQPAGLVWLTDVANVNQTIETIIIFFIWVSSCAFFFSVSSCAIIVVHEKKTVIGKSFSFNVYATRFSISAVNATKFLPFFCRNEDYCVSSLPVFLSILQNLFQSPQFLLILNSFFHCSCGYISIHRPNFPPLDYRFN